jgi:hypothetical protein
LDDPGRATLWGIPNRKAQEWDVATGEAQMAPYTTELFAQTALQVEVVIAPRLGSHLLILG